ncbi:MAG TPA: hypothetical protein VFV66_10680 [Nonomuraea sp.]|nr:hypothetical protein [Nonomuraea sp.]
MFRPSTLFASAILAATVAALPLAGTVANAQTTTQSTAHSTVQNAAQRSAACRKIRITGGNVAIRDFPFVNGLVLRSVRTGTTLTACQRVRLAGSSYANKCGRAGTDWYKVRSGRVTITGSPFGYVPVTCARVL